jgi:hypothetical protein
MYGFIYAFYDVYGGTFFPLFMLSLSFFIMIRYIKRSLKENLHRLWNQLTIMRSVLRLHPEGSPVLRDFTVLTHCKNTLTGLLLAHLLVSLFDMTRAVHGQPEWLGHLLYAIWMVAAVLYVYIAFRMRGPVVWNARTLDSVQARARVEERQMLEMQRMEEGGRKMEGPVSKPEAFSKAIFMQVGMLELDKIDEEEGEGGTVDMAEENSSAAAAAVGGATRTISLATAPWRVSPGTFVLDPTEMEEQVGKESESGSKEWEGGAATVGMTKEKDVEVVLEVAGVCLDEVSEEEGGAGAEGIVDGESEVEV